MVSKYFSGIFYLISILLGNLFVIYFGIIDILILEHTSKEILFTIITPAGAVWIGLMFSARDFAQRFWSHKVWFWMLAATLITYFLNRNVALASVTAFIVAEATDWFFYTILRADLKTRVIVSNLFSCPLDSLIFVTIAFGFYWPAIWGQALVKYLSGLLVIPLIPYIEKAYDRLKEK